MEMTRHRCTVCISSELKPGSQPFLFLFRCRQLEYYHQWFIIATQMIIGGSLHFSICQKNTHPFVSPSLPVILILRTYALYERNNRVLGLVLVISAGAVGACIVCSVSVSRSFCSAII